MERRKSPPVPRIAVNPHTTESSVLIQFVLHAYPIARQQVTALLEKATPPLPKRRVNKIAKGLGELVDYGKPKRPWQMESGPLSVLRNYTAALAKKTSPQVAKWREFSYTAQKAWQAANKACGAAREGSHDFAHFPHYLDELGKQMSKLDKDLIKALQPFRKEENVIACLLRQADSLQKCDKRFVQKQLQRWKYTSYEQLRRLLESHFVARGMAHVVDSLLPIAEKQFP